MLSRPARAVLATAVRYAGRLAGLGPSRGGPGAGASRRRARCPAGDRAGWAGDRSDPPAAPSPTPRAATSSRTRQGRVIYVGKAKSLRSRLSNYFQNPANLPPRTAQMVATAESVEWIQVAQRRRSADARVQPHQAAPAPLQHPAEGRQELPVPGRHPRRRVAPGHGHAGRQAQGRALLRALRPRLRHPRDARPAAAHLPDPHLLGQQARPAREAGSPVPAVPHREVLGALRGRDRPRPPTTCWWPSCIDFLDGNTDAIVGRLETEMREAADELEFERAARLRDRLDAVRKAIEQAADGGGQGTRTSTWSAIADDELEAAVQVFFVRRGRVVGRKGFVIDKVEDVSPGELVDSVLEGLYYDPPPLGVPKQVLVPVESADPDLYQRWLTEQRGSRVTIRVPQRGDKRALLETVTRNATEEFTRHRLRRASDHNSRAKALNELQDALGLPEAPLRIECYDMSHIQGTDYVGSMVVLEDGLPAKSEYRRFKIKGARATTTSRPWRRCSPGASPTTSSERERPVSERGPLRLPAAAAAGRRGQGPAVRGRAGASTSWASTEEIPRGVAGQALRGGLRAGPVRPGAHPPPERGAVPAAAHPRRGPPLRHHLPPRAAGQAHDQVGARRHPRARARPARSGCVKELGGVRRGQAGLARATCCELSWLPDAVADAVYDKIHTAGPIDRVHHRSEPTLTRRPARRAGDLWEDHADVVAAGVHRGRRSRVRRADPAAGRAPGWPASTGCSTSARGEGQVARRLHQAGGAAAWSGVDPTAGPGARGPPARPEVRPTLRAGAADLPFADASFDAVGGLPRVRAHRRPRRGASPRSARVLRPGGRFVLLPQPPAAADPAAAAGSTTRSSTRPSSTGASGPT